MLSSSKALLSSNKMLDFGPGHTVRAQEDVERLRVKTKCPDSVWVVVCPWPVTVIQIRSLYFTQNMGGEKSEPNSEISTSHSGGSPFNRCPH